MKEEHNERALTMIWDLRRLIKLYEGQLREILELVPENFNHKAVIEKLKAHQLTKARSLTRKPRKKNAG